LKDIPKYPDFLEFQAFEPMSMNMSEVAPDSDRPAEQPAEQPVVLPRSQHTVSRKHINEHTLKVLYRLRRHGHLAYLVGGGVRDLLLERRPKDFDVVTDATPNQVKKLFRNCFLVGRRFRLAHIRFANNYLVEVATFRRKPRPEELPEDPADHFFFAENVFGDPRQDAFRRDFTINALFYSIDDFSLIDYVGGLRDLQERRLRVIGDPRVRFAEDPVRMLRALEFTARLGFTLDETTREAIYECAPLIAEAAPARVREELLELFRHSVAGAVLRDAQAMGMLAPMLAGYQAGEETFALLEELDRRTASGTPLEEPVVLAALFLARFRQAMPDAGEGTIGEVLRLGNLVLTPLCNYFRIAHGTRARARELLVGFFRLMRGRGRRGEARFLRHPATSAALAFFALWSDVSGQARELLADWRQAVESVRAPSSATASRKPRRRPRRRRRSKKRPAQTPEKS
jgi:poly(A) polymerase